ncbi:PadR family transcriptional regulator [Deinococcus psychrotolerans]|uniref:PadR family transcriptional regulator n=1 Tax=Deinococcus psychrotolerans TaxID=2489213 RepID=A0A3G8Y7W4_9DEIO|nr:helix-turn-helix transcriptional regulator [Deinococcus psychrotolerans]AZI41469.1 PadR family transcriptional regulator [Deinococcus psychrotolerans]
MNNKQQLRMLILAVLERQPEHGYAIAQAIKGRSEGLLSAKEGTLYPALHALEAEQLVESSETEVGGRIRREYRLTERGRKELTRAQGDWQRQIRAVSAVMGGEG